MNYGMTWLVHRLSTAAVRRVRASDALALLPETLAYRAVVHMLAGELVAAEDLLTEADSTSLSTRCYSPAALSLACAGCVEG